MKKFFEEPVVDVLKIETAEATMASVDGLPSIGNEDVDDNFFG